MAFMHTNLAVVTGMVAEVSAISGALLEQLLGKLRSNIQLPECLRVIGYLRRLGIFSEQVQTFTSTLEGYHSYFKVIWETQA